MPRPTCFQNHMGVWAMYAPWFEAALAAIRSGIWRPEAMGRAGDGWGLDAAKLAAPSRADVVVVSEQPAAPGALSYAVTDEGVAVIDVEGPLMKAQSKYGGTSTVALRGALRQARADDRVRAVMLRIDSPGGHVAGTHEAAEEVRATSKQKPVFAHIEDLGASAAYWIASAAKRVTANAAAEVGSIGVFALLIDDSKRAEMLGVRTVLVATGPHKGTGAPGQAITEEQLGPIRESVDALGALFAADVQAGRRLTDERLAEVTSGRVWPAADAVKLRLVDAVATFDEAVAGAVEKIGGRSGRRARAADLRARELDLGSFLDE